VNHLKLSVAGCSYQHPWGFIYSR